MGGSCLRVRISLLNENKCLKVRIDLSPDVMITQRNICGISNFLERSFHIARVGESL